MDIKPLLLAIPTHLVINVLLAQEIGGYFEKVYDVGFPVNFITYPSKAFCARATQVIPAGFFYNMPHLKALPATNLA